MIVKKVRDYLKQSGYTYTDFDNLLEENIEIVNLTYNLFFKNKKKININKHIGCLNSIFNIIKGTADTTKDVIEMNFKRVNVFKPMNSIKSFITLQRQRNESLQDIVTQLVDNYPNEVPNTDKALEIIGEWQQEIQMKVDSFGLSQRIIDSNPGFFTKIESRIISGNHML